MPSDAVSVPYETADLQLMKAVHIRPDAADCSVVNPGGQHHEPTKNNGSQPTDIADTGTQSLSALDAALLVARLAVRIRHGGDHQVRRRACVGWRGNHVVSLKPQRWSHLAGYSFGDFLRNHLSLPLVLVLLKPTGFAHFVAVSQHHILHLRKALQKRL